MHLYTWTVSAPPRRRLEAVVGAASSFVAEKYPFPSLRPNLALRLSGDGSAVGSIGDFRIVAVPQLVESAAAVVNGEEVVVRKAAVHADIIGRTIELRPHEGSISAACFFCDLAVEETFVRLKAEGAATRVTVLRQEADTRGRRENSGFALVQLAGNGRVVASRMKTGVLFCQPTLEQQVTLLERDGYYVSLFGDETSLRD